MTVPGLDLTELFADLAELDGRYARSARDAARRRARGESFIRVEWSGSGTENCMPLPGDTPL
ncbi:hypothetical protein [Streptomyces jumonjinensis]|uniref:Uncharacterized protein n=1 Tax=Streptomyces jumonjinensis TaxID=1945 RepID=A0A646KP77_STRJU|nr:hypothetical protein [Streptomyces jumonjinensis]MQT03867.1 hypothetical protein [Streptomyces jumonjinensis]